MAPGNSHKPRNMLVNKIAGFLKKFQSSDIQEPKFVYSEENILQRIESGNTWQSQSQVVT